MTKTSAGILPYRIDDEELQVFLVHPGGPFWAKKDLQSWSLAKGEFTEEEDPMEAAVREFREETGLEPGDDLKNLGFFKQPSGKIVHAWCVESDLDESKIESNTFLLEWPRGSGIKKEYPEVDRAEWFGIFTARQKVMKGQLPIIDALLTKIPPEKAALAREEPPTQSPDGPRQSTLFD